MPTQTYWIVIVRPFCREPLLKDMALFSFPLDEAPFFGALALVEDLNF